MRDYERKRSEVKKFWHGKLTKKQRMIFGALLIIILFVLLTRLL